MREKERRGNVTIPLHTSIMKNSQKYMKVTMLLVWKDSNIAMIFMIESLLCCHFHILVGILHYRTWLVYSNDVLPQNSHHTYLLWHFHSHSEIYCHATFHRSGYYDTLHHCNIALHDHVVDIVFVAKPPFIILSFMSLMHHCTSRYTAGGIHIESYLVLSIEL